MLTGDAADAPAGPAPAEGAPRWWDRRGYVLLLVVLAILPLVWPPIPPLTDVMGHMGAYRIEIAPASSPLHQWFSFDWRPVGNLAVDTLVVPIAHVFGLEPAVKLIVMAIPAIEVIGMLMVAREVHGRLPPTAVFALPFAWCWPLQFGFINYALAMGLALIGFAWWLRLTQQGRWRARAIAAILLSPPLWLAHSFGWATLVILAGAAEWTRLAGGDRGWVRAAPRAALAVLPLMPPLVLMALGHDPHAPPAIVSWWPWRFKIGYFLFSLRAHLAGFDLFSLAVISVLVLAGIARAGLRMAAPLGLAALLLGLLYLALPFQAMNGSYVDMRVVPYALAVAVLALAPAARMHAREQALLAAAGLALFAGRMAVSTVAMANHAAAYRVQLHALDHLPRGARVFALVRMDCSGRWDPSRMDHLGAMAIVRRDDFVNGQWALPGVQPLRIHFPAPDRFTGDATQVIRPWPCSRIDRSHYPQVLGQLPKGAFDYVWLIDFLPATLPHLPWLAEAWHGPTGALYRILPSQPEPLAAPAPRA